ncbi:hypothetical protein QBC40DRAFT_216965 [Triangularia verruculosa]|uniref:Uncharacterized protein n=1 Tax=Triangularia verruculosa TaxID=2587418 RepID=A0AAN6XTQ3_9PEZI|nr:hypothetical protein QBC40DRAFT_216965 [Triangularia verruculosa]
MLPRACLATARPLQRIFFESFVRTRLPPLQTHQAYQVRHHVYRTARRQVEAKRLFTDDEIPSQEAWQRLERGQTLRVPEGITIERLEQVVRVYCNIATSQALAWQAKLQSAITLWSVSGQKLCMHILATASAMGYNPSTVSLMKLLAQMDKFYEARLQPYFRDVETRFRVLARTTRDPDILTVQGLIALREQDESAALRFFQQALAAAQLRKSIMPPLLPGDFESDGSSKEGTGRPLRFAYEKSCYYKLGQLLKKKGQLDEASEAFKVAAEELRYAPALVEYARTVPLGKTAEFNRYRELLLTSAAGALNVEAFRQLVADSLMKYENPAVYSPKEFKEESVDERVIWEWCLLGLSWSKKFPFTNRAEFYRVQKAIWDNAAKMSLVKQDPDTGEVTLTIWVYPSKQQNVEPVRFDITI